MSRSLGRPRFSSVPMTQPSRLRQFWMPLFSSLPVAIVRTFQRWIGYGIETVAPVNQARGRSGILVTPDLAMQLSAVWACSWLYARVIGTLPLHLQRTGPKNSATRAPDHPLYGVLHDIPNQEMSASSFWQSQVMGMMLWGAGYARKLRNAKGQVVGLVPLRPEFMTVYRLPGQPVRYRYAANGIEPEDLSADQVFVMFDRTVDGYAPISRIQYGANSLSDAINADRAAGQFWRKGLRASGVLTIAQWLKDAQREAYRARLAEFAGPGSETGDEATDLQGGIMILENATKFEQLTMKPADVEMLSSRRHSIEDICRWFDVPPILVGHSQEGQTMWGTGVEQLILGWLKLGLAPLLKRVEQEIYRQLLSPAERATLYAEFDVDALLRGDTAARAQFMSIAAQNGLRTRDELRAIDNLPPLPGGGELTVQSNLVPLRMLGDMIAGGGGEAEQIRSMLRQFLGVATPDPAPREEAKREA